MFAYLVEYHRYANIVGIGVVLVLAWLLSVDRTRINKWLVLKALALQVFFGALLVKVPAIEQYVLQPIANGMSGLLGYASTGARFVFGNLVDLRPDAWGCVFAFRVLPLIIFFAVLASILSHYGIIQWVVSGFNKIIRPLLGTSGPETLAATSNIVLSQSESPLLIKQYLASLTESQLFVVMVSGMAHMSAGMCAVYYTMGVPMQHMLIAAVMGIPGSILLAKMVVPDTQEQSTQKDIVVDESRSGNILDAIFQGTSSGTQLAIIVGAMLLVFIALLPLVDTIICWIGALINWPLSFAQVQIPALSLSLIFGWLFAPFAYLMGLEGTELTNVAYLLGTKISINEFVAFSRLSTMQFSERTLALLTYAIGNFAAFASIGMQVAGISALAPSCRTSLTKLGLRALLAASLVGLLSAFIMGLLI